MQSKKYADSSDKDNQVMLGFAEKPKPKDLLRDNFPSKIGGLPIWIIPPLIPLSSFSCSLCHKPLSFLLQLYCPLEEVSHCYHRYLYAFFCSLCWKKSNLIKVFRVQLAESSQFNNYDALSPIDLNGLTAIESINSHLSKALALEEHIINTTSELPKASELYFKFYNSVDEKSVNSSLTDQEGDEEYIQVNQHEEKELNEMLNAYLKENKDDDINKVEVEANHEQTNDKLLTRNEDLIFDLFSRVVSYDPEQVVRYYRNDYFPLWFTQNGMLSVTNTRCRQCQGEVGFEFQVMPYLFLILPQISMVDIGTIVVYTCKSSCKGKTVGNFVEEYGFIQRTGENFCSVDDNANSKALPKKDEEVNGTKTILFKGVKEEDADDDGFIEVKKKKK